MKKIWIILAIGAIILSGCSAKQTSLEYPMPAATPAYDRGAVAEESYIEGEKGGAPATYDDATGNGVEASTVERLVIKNASLGIAVLDPVASLNAIGKLAEEMGGFLVSSNMSKYMLSTGVEVPRGSITIRVPSEKLDEALVKIKAMAADPETGILNESITGQDVTAEYTDSKSRLKNLQAAEEQLVELLASATDLQYTLEIFRELTSIRSQIEVLQGQIKYYEEAAALSAISVDIVGESSLQPIEIAGWKPKGIAKDAVQTLIKTLQGIGTALIWFGIYCLPFLIPLGVALFFIIKGARKAKAKKRARKQAEAIMASAPPAGTVQR
jgi:hypothetical protein